MMHKFKLLLALLCFSVQTQSFSNDAKLLNTHGSPEDFSCNLVVTGLHTTNITTNSITVAWNPDPNFSSVEVTAYDSITNAVLAGPITAAAGSAYLGWLPSSTSVKIGAVPRCLNGELSTQTTYIFARTKDIVIEIVGKGRAPLSCQDPNTLGTQTLSGSGPYSFAIDFEQTYQCEIVKQVPGGTNLVSRFLLNSTDNRAFIDNKQTEAGIVTGWDGGPGNYVLSRFMANGAPLCTLFVSSIMTNSGFLTLRDIATNGAIYTFTYGACGGDGFRQVEDRGSIHGLSENISISPNPFNDHLTIQFPEDNENDGLATAAIYHLNGMLAQSQTLDASSGKTLTMNTSDLPAGMYLLRTETLTGVTTKLVMKAE